jgi:nitrile hydratase
MAQQRKDDQVVPADVALRVKALESLSSKRVWSTSGGRHRRCLREQSRPRSGARVVARAWVDPAYKKRLLTGATVNRRTRVWRSARRLYGR